MDTTIRNIDEEACRRLRTWVAHQGIGVGEALSQLVIQHVSIPKSGRRRTSIWDMKPWHWGPGTERTSEEVDEIAYGAKRE